MNFYKKNLQAISYILTITVMLLSVLRMEINGVSAAVGPIYGLTRVIGGTAADLGRSIATDSVGNIYVTGYFQGTGIQFNTTGSGSSDLKSSNGAQDIFVTKYNADGSYGWTRTIGSTIADSASNIATDSNGNIYVTGYFQGTGVEFNTTGSGSSDLKSSNGAQDIYATKYNADGSYGWTKTMGSTGGDFGSGMAIDNLGNIYVLGYFQGTGVEFNTTGSGSSDLKSSNGAQDIFVTKYNAAGSYGWTRTMGGTTLDVGYGIATNSVGNIYVTGMFQGTGVEFNTTGTGSSDLKNANGGSDVFTIKYNANGSYGWTKITGSTESDGGYEITTDRDDNVYVTGYFQGTGVEFNTTGSGSSDLKSSNGAQDVFATKYNADGSYGWTKTIGGTAVDTGSKITTDSNGNIYALGYFSGTGVEFNTTGSGSSDQKNSNGGADVFVTKYNADGSYGWTRTIGGTAADSGSKITTDSNDNIYVAGYFQGTGVEFNTTGSGSSDLKNSNGVQDIFITKYFLDNFTLDNVNVANSAVLTSNWSTDVSSVFQSGIKNIGVTKGISKIATFDVNFNASHDWANVYADSAAGKSLLRYTEGNFANIPGKSSAKYTLYVPKTAQGAGLNFCPSATVLADITETCSGGAFIASGSIGAVGSDTVTVTSGSGTYAGYWVVSGLSVNMGAVENLKPTIRITDIGLIGNVPDKSPLFYYFTSQTPTIKGKTEGNATVHFKYGSNDYTVVADNSGNYTINIPELPRKYITLEYFAADQAGNKSGIRKLNLMIGEENFPGEVGEQTGTASPSISVTPTGEPTNKPTVSEIPEENPQSYELLIVDQNGAPIADVPVFINGERYTTNANGKLYIEQSLSKDAEIYVEIDGVRQEGSVNGSKVIVEIQQENQTETSGWYWWLWILFFALVGSWIYRKYGLKSKR